MARDELKEVFWQLDALTASQEGARVVLHDDQGDVVITRETSDRFPGGARRPRPIPTTTLRIESPEATTIVVGNRNTKRIILEGKIPHAPSR